MSLRLDVDPTREVNRTWGEFDPGAFHALKKLLHETGSAHAVW